MTTVGSGTSSVGKPVNSYRPRIALDFGGGLDRQTGIMAQQRGGEADLRNIHLYEGKAQLRRGAAITAADLTVGETVMTHLLSGCAVQAEGVGIVAGYSSETRDVHLFRVSGDGTAPEWLYEWFTHSAAAGDTLPIIHSAEVGQRAFFAHDEMVLSRRAPTVFYSGVGISILEAPTSEDEPNAWAAGGREAATDPKYNPQIRFRGVRAWRDYLLGWGFGDNVTDRPELVRISIAGLVDPIRYDPEIYPVAFDRDHWWMIGQRDDPVLDVNYSSSELLAMKGGYSALLIGDSWLNFGRIDADRLFGIAGPRLSVELNGTLFVWTAEGPAISEGGPLRSIANPLDLFGEEPTDLVEASDWPAGFAYWQPKRREVVFQFGQRGYAMSLIDPQNPRWIYRESGVPIYAAMILHGPASYVAAAPIGHPEFVEPTAGTDDISMVARWLNVDQNGDEMVETWMRFTGDDEWEKVTGDVRVNFASTQFRKVPTEPGRSYDIAFRYRRGSEYTAGYDSDDPMDWPSVSRGTFSSALKPPLYLAGVWSRTSAIAEQILFTWTNRFPDIAMEYRIDGGAWTSLSAAVTQYLLAAATGEDINLFEIRYVTDEVDGEIGAAGIWGGPATIPTVRDLVAIEDRVTMSWLNGNAALASTIEYLNVTSADTDDRAVAAGFVHEEIIYGGGNATNGDVIEVRARHRATAFTIEDFGEWSAYLTGEVSF